MMSFMNEIYEIGSIDKERLLSLTKLLSPFAPHICEEMWESLGMTGFCSTAKWPEYDEAKCVDNVVEMPVQVNGKVRSTITIAAAAHTTLNLHTAEQ